MIQHLFILTCLLTSSLAASQATPEYPAYKAELLTALNNVIRAEKKRPVKQEELVVFKTDLKTLINKKVTFAQHALDDLQTQLDNPRTAQSDATQITKIANQLAVLKATLEEAPTVDTAPDKTERDTKQVASAPAVVAVPKPAKSGPHLSAAIKFIDNQNFYQLDKLGFNNIHQQLLGKSDNLNNITTLQETILNSADASNKFGLEEISLKNVHSESQLLPVQPVGPSSEPRQALPTLPASYRAPAGYNESAALARAVAESLAPAGYDEKAALAAAMAASLAKAPDKKPAAPNGPKNSEEIDVKHRLASAPNALSSAASATAAVHPAQLPAPTSDREAEEIAIALKLSVAQSAANPQPQVATPVSHTSPVFVVPRNSASHRAANNVENMLEGYKDKFLLAGAVGLAGLYLYLLSQHQK